MTILLIKDWPSILYLLFKLACQRVAEPGDALAPADTSWVSEAL